MYQISERKAALLWEAMARLNIEPRQAALKMAGHGLAVPVAVAERELNAARERNDLRLVSARDITSNWHPTTRC